MTPEERELLTKMARTVEENNHLLHKIRSSMRWDSIFRWIYWILIIGSAVGAFVLLQPYLDRISSSYSGVQNFVNNFKQ